MTRFAGQAASDSTDPWFDELRNVIARRARSGDRQPADDGFPWSWYCSIARPNPEGLWRRLREAARRQARRLLPSRSGGYRWLSAHRAELAKTRASLADEASRQAFDAHLLLQVLGPWQFAYAPRIEPPLTVSAQRPFDDVVLSADYMGLSLEWFDVLLAETDERVEVLTTRLQTHLLECFGQYFPDGAARVCRPRDGDVVLDCGSCVGDMSVVYAAAVGRTGRVVAFDPLPVHHRYLERQLEANPAFRDRITAIESAVGDTTREPSSGKRDRADRISAGFRPDDQMRFVRLDDFVADHGLDRVDLIKMDIEGSEPDALRGAERLIRRFRPRLAISAYHDRQHLVELPRIIREIEPAYRFGFAQHSPVPWEAVLYAWCDSGGALTDARTIGTGRVTAGSRD
jgi:FkbM family methyltransferase